MLLVAQASIAVFLRQRSPSRLGSIPAMRDLFTRIRSSGHFLREAYKRIVITEQVPRAALNKSYGLGPN